MQNYSMVHEFYYNESAIVTLKTKKIFYMLFDDLSFGFFDIDNQIFEPLNT